MPPYRYPDAAALLFNFMWKYSYNLKGIYETPALLPESEFGGKLDRSQVEQLIQTVHTEGRTLLTELEAKQILSAYGIPVVESRTAYTAEAAVACAEAIGFPVVVKLISKTITHKSDVGGGASDPAESGLCKKRLLRKLSLPSTKKLEPTPSKGSRYNPC